MMEVGDENTWFTECLHTINDVRIYTYSISWLGISYFLQDSPHSKLSIHYVSKISEKRIDSKISESNAIEFIKDDAVKSDKSYRQRVDVSFVSIR